MTSPTVQQYTSATVRYLEDLIVGDNWVTKARTITETDVVTFATWSGDMHPLHTNEEYARSTEFGRRIAHGPGALSIAFGLEMSLGWKDPSAIAFLGIRDWSMRAPIFIGDTIFVRERVTEIRPSKSKPDRGIVVTRVELCNQRDEICQEGDWVVLLSRRPEEAR
ncbi:MaoC/PaaZ C-terminal domain-containing protein [Streptomyces sp. NPDC005708]|uniref:MaoC/PaaZ C-terminal domain-containing protein n=1 Tax=Streptomyces sp. NPDC005708 TaxID=3154564 RepID=UPI0033FD3347